MKDLKKNDKVKVSYTISMLNNEKKITFDGVVKKTTKSFIMVLNTKNNILAKFFFSDLVNIIKCQ